MEFKPAKSMSIVLRKGHIQDQFRFRIGEDLIPTVSERPIKSLGKLFRAELNDPESVKEMLGQAEAWMRAFNRSGLPGSHSNSGATSMVCSQDFLDHCSCTV